MSLLFEGPSSNIECAKRSVHTDRSEEITVKIVTLPAKGWMAFRTK